MPCYISLNSTMCCGLEESYNFVDDRSTEDQREKLRIRLQQGDTALRFFVLTKNPGTMEIRQPKWFVDMLKSFRGFTQSPWTMNPNSGNYCSVVTWCVNEDFHDVNS